MTAYSRAAILEWVDTHRSDVVGMAQSLVRIPSENKQPHGSEKACQMFVAETLRDLGCRVDVFTPLEVAGLTEHPAYGPGHDYTDRPNVVGVLSRQTDSPVGVAAGRRSLLFTGHIDVVPAVGQGQYGWWDGTVAEGRASDARQGSGAPGDSAAGCRSRPAPAATIRGCARRRQALRRRIAGAHPQPQRQNSHFFSSCFSLGTRT